MNIDSWKITSETKPGFHCINDPSQGKTRSLWVYRLNLEAGKKFTFIDAEREFSFAMISGNALLKHGQTSYNMNKLDTFYLPSNISISITASTDCVLYIGAAKYEGYGEFFFHTFDSSLELGAVRQIHGQKPYQRDVYMTLGPEVEASRLICGFTWSELGAWSSWPPHQHQDDLEEAYCYFDMDPPSFGIHISYLESGKPTHAHIVQSGDIVLAPAGYHPTVASPTVKNCYFWILGAHSHASRRYDLAITDPAFSFS